jgi:hypothetical protein
MRDWRTDAERATDARERPFLVAEAWSVGLLIAIGMLSGIAIMFDYLMGR